MIRALYSDKPHQFHEDGLRFSTLGELKQHTDRFMERKKLLQKKKDVREYREWYCTANQWVTDFNALRGDLASVSLSGSGTDAGQTTGGSSSGKASSGSGGGGGGTTGIEQEEEYVLAADEHFTRCPVSREVFECIWDDEEGEMIYRHAAKVLVTEAADPALFQLAQPIAWETATTNQVRYLIVHKVLVLDQWISSGRAVPLLDAVMRYKSMPGPTGVAKAEQLQNAIGEEDDEDDVFVLLEFSS